MDILQHIYLQIYLTFMGSPWPMQHWLMKTFIQKSAQNVNFEPMEMKCALVRGGQRWSWIIFSLLSFSPFKLTSSQKNGNPTEPYQEHIFGSIESC